LRDGSVLQGREPFTNEGMPFINKGGRERFFKGGRELFINEGTPFVEEGGTCSLTG